MPYCHTSRKKAKGQIAAIEAESVELLRDYLLETLFESRNVNEAPLADEDPIIVPTRKQLPPEAVTEPYETSPMPSKDRTKIERYFSTPKYFRDAKRYFDNINVNVHILTRPGSTSAAFDGPKEYRGNVRYGVFGPKVAAKTLEQLGFIDPSLIEKVVKYLEMGHSVIVPMAAGIPADFWPSPWMTVHAAADNENGVLAAIGREMQNESRAAEILADEIDPRFVSALTMKSARNDKIIVVEDMFAEIITQEVLTKGGFRYNPTGDDEVDEALQELKEMVSGARQAWEREIKGNLVIINVVLDDFVE